MGPPTNSSSRLRPGMAGNCTQDPLQGLERDRPPRQAPDRSQEWRGIAPGTLCLDQRGTTHHQEGKGTAPSALRLNLRGTTHEHQKETLARYGGELQPGTSAETVAGRPTNTSSRPNQSRAGNCTQTPPQGLASDHQPSLAADPSQNCTRDALPRIGKAQPSNTSSRPKPERAGKRTKDKC